MSQITIGSFPYTLAQGPYLTGTVELRLWYIGAPGDQFIDSLGNAIPFGNAGSFYKSISCTVSSNTITVPAFTLPSTDDSSNISVVTRAQFYVNSSPAEFLWSDWIVTATLGASISFASLFTYNLAASIPYRLDPLYLQAPDVAALIATAIGTLNDASSTVKGRTLLSIDPTVSTSPRAYGTNDTHQPTLTSPVYWASQYASFNAAVTAIGSAQATLVVDKTLTGITNATIPATLTLQFAGAGSLSITTGQTLTIQGAIQAVSRQIFVNILAGQGTVSFTGNRSILRYQLAWFGSAADWSVDAQPALQAAVNAVPDNSFLMGTTNAKYALATTLTISDRTSLYLVTESANKNQDQNGGPFSGFKWIGSAGGTMLSLDRCRYCKVSGWTFLLAPTGINNANVGIDIDGYSAGHISTGNEISNCRIYSAANASFVGIRISHTATNNNEDMQLLNNSIQGSNDFPSNNGTGVEVGSANAMNQLISRGSITNCKYGVLMTGGFANIEFMDMGYNSVDLYLPTNGGTATYERNSSEGSKQILYDNVSSPVIVRDNLRLDSSGQLTATGFFQFGIAAGTVIIEGNSIGNPPGGGFVLDGSAAHNTRLYFRGNRFASGVAYTDLGYPSFDPALNTIIDDWNFYVASGAPGFPNTSRFFLGHQGYYMDGSLTVLTLFAQGEGAALSISSNTIAPTNSIHQVGTGLIKTITVPTGFTSGTISLVPTAAFTYDATGNILGSGTAVVGRTMIATFSSSTSKWSMSY